MGWVDQASLLPATLIGVLFWGGTHRSPAYCPHSVLKFAKKAVSPEYRAYLRGHGTEAEVVGLMRDMHSDPIMAITAAAALVVLTCDSPDHAVQVSTWHCHGRNGAVASAAWHACFTR